MKLVFSFGEFQFFYLATYKGELVEFLVGLGRLVIIRRRQIKLNYLCIYIYLFFLLGSAQGLLETTTSGQAIGCCVQCFSCILYGYTAQNKAGCATNGCLVSDAQPLVAVAGCSFAPSFKYYITGLDLFGWLHRFKSSCSPNILIVEYFLSFLSIYMVLYVKTVKHILGV